MTTTHQQDAQQGSRRPRRQTLLAGVLTLLALSGGAIAAAGPASAAGNSYISSNSGGANWRTCASTSCGLVVSDGYLPNGTIVYMGCYYDGQTVSPPNSNYTSARWFRVGIQYNNASGFVHSSLVANQTSVPRCASGSI